MLQDDDDELGDLWQDEQNMAALLLYKQSGRNQYSLVSLNHSQYTDLVYLADWLVVLHWWMVRCFYGEPMLIEAVRADQRSGTPAIL